MEVIKITPEVEKIICDKIINNIPAKEIVKEYNISYQKIRNMLIRNNIKFKLYTNIKITPEIEKEICKLYNEGQTISVIGIRYNVVPSTIYKYLLKNNIDIRYSCIDFYKFNKRMSLNKKERGYHSLNPCIGNGRQMINGYERHHVNKNDIIYVPIDYNQNVPHNLSSGFNMSIVNTMAYFFLIQCNIKELNKLFR